MADESKKPDSKPSEAVEVITAQSVQDVALVLFAERSRYTGGTNVRRVARQCFSDAETFLEVSAAYKPGMNAIADADKRANCCAPKLPKWHPHNMVSRQMGDLKKVQAIYEWLVANPLAETYESPDGLFTFDVPTTKLARQLFPEYCKPVKVPAAV